MRFHHIIEIDISDRALKAIGILAGVTATPLVNQLLAIITGELKTMADRTAELTAEIAQLKIDAAANTSAEQSAIVLINGFTTALAAALEAARSAGATDAQLADLSDLHGQFSGAATELAAAVAANPLPESLPAPPADTSGTGEGTPAPADQTGAPQSDGSQGDGAAGTDAATAGTGDGTVTGDQPQP